MKYPLLLIAIFVALAGHSQTIILGVGMESVNDLGLIPPKSFSDNGFGVEFAEGDKQQTLALSLGYRQRLADKLSVDVVAGYRERTRPSFLYGISNRVGVVTGIAALRFVYGTKLDPSTGEPAPYDFAPLRMSTLGILPRYSYQYGRHSLGVGAGVQLETILNFDEQTIDSSSLRSPVAAVRHHREYTILPLRRSGLSGLVSLEYQYQFTPAFALGLEARGFRSLTNIYQDGYGTTYKLRSKWVGYGLNANLSYTFAAGRDKSRAAID